MSIETKSQIAAELALRRQQNGVKEPLVVSADGFILSGHRLYIAAKLAGFDAVPCRVVAVRRADDINQFAVLLREHNRQRDKSLADRFVAEHGDDAVSELEALEPTTLQQILTESIESVINTDLYNAEVDAEAKDAAFLDGIRNTVHEALKQMNWEQDE